MRVFGQEVQEGTTDHTVVFWTHGDQRRAIITESYGDARETVERVLRRFRAGPGYYESIHRKLGELIEPGTAIAVRHEGHRAGLMRPYLTDRELGDVPYIVCRDHRGVPTTPVLCASRDHARSFASAASLAEGLSRSGWLGFQCERLRSPIDALLYRAIDGSIGLRSEFEEAMHRVLVTPEAPQRPKRRRKHAA